MAGEGLGSGLGAQIGIAEEPLWGTITTPDRFYEFLTESLDDQVESLDGPPSLGRGPFARHDRTISYATQGAGDVVLVVTNKAFAKLFKLCLGSHVQSWPGSTNANRVLTFTANPATGGTVTIGTTIYTFRATLTAPTTAFEVLIDTTFALTIQNLMNAINRGPGGGTKYGSLTTEHPTVVATATATTLTVTDKMARGAAAADATTATATNCTWGGATLTGGVNGTDTARLHTITYGDRLTYGKSATIQVVRPSRDGTDNPFTYAGGKVREWTLSVDMDGWVQLSITWDTKSAVLTTPVAVATYASGASNYDFTQIAVTVGGVTLPCTSFSITGTNALQDDTRLLNNQKREPLANDFWSITGEMNTEFTDLTAYQAFLAATQATLVATITGGLIPGSASRFSLTVTVATMKYTGSSPQVGGPDVLEQNLPFMAYKNLTDPVVSIAYQTSDTAA